MTPTLDALVRQLREAMAQVDESHRPWPPIVSENREQLLDWIALCSPANMATLLAALTDAQTRAEDAEQGNTAQCLCAQHAEILNEIATSAYCLVCEIEKAEARATQAEQRIADYQDTVRQRDEIIAELTTRCARYQEEASKQRARADRLQAAWESEDIR